MSNVKIQVPNEECAVGCIYLGVGYGLRGLGSQAGRLACTTQPAAQAHGPAGRRANEHLAFAFRFEVGYFFYVCRATLDRGPVLRKHMKATK